MKVRYHEPAYMFTESFAPLGRIRRDFQIPGKKSFHRGVEAKGIVNWVGPQAGTSTPARVNREICTRLILRGQPIRFFSGENLASVGEASEKGKPGQITIRHGWPIGTKVPPDELEVIFLPWEYGRLPAAWMRRLNAAVEVWVYSEFMRRCCLQSGLSAERVHIVSLNSPSSQRCFGKESAAPRAAAKHKP